MTRLFAGTQWDQPPHCERCGKLESECRCIPVEEPIKIPRAPQRQTARVDIEKRKRGKLMTVVRGLAAADNALPELLTQLKNECGAGGTLQDDSLEIQGNHVDRVRKILSQIGYRVR